ncbi:UNVERIFIED_ORG: hypothetical protein J2X79_004326 [Arthrobacter globiformis]|nr:hypothetical protein [Arthrobacter globiformis]
MPRGPGGSVDSGRTTSQLDHPEGTGRRLNIQPGISSHFCCACLRRYLGGHLNWRYYDQRHLDRGNVDRGNVDRGNVDRGNVDRGNVDRGNVDRGHVDRGHVDRGHVDRGNVDRGHVDRGHVDRGHVDRGNVDRGNVDRRHNGDDCLYRTRAGYSAAAAVSGDVALVYGDGKSG